MIGFESESGCLQVQGVGGGGGPGEIQQCLQVIPGQHRERERRSWERESLSPTWPQSALETVLVDS